MAEEIILASASPRRAQLLALMGVSFLTDVSAVDDKARAVALRHPGRIVLAADTLINFRMRLLGKPQSADEAVAMLRALRAVWHSVITGVAVINGATGQEFATVEATRVLMRRYSDTEIAAYVASGDPMDKAAAYAIQNRSFHPVERLDTCYSNVMGLPMCATSELLQQAGYTLPVHGEALRAGECSFCQMARG
jgi:MAF protein